MSREHPRGCSSPVVRASSRAVASAWSPTLLPSAPSSSWTFSVLNSVAQQCSQRHMGTCGGRSRWFVHTNPTPPASAPSTPPLTLDRLYIEQPRHSREHQRPPRGTQSVAVPQGRFPAQRGSRHAGPSTRESAKPNHPPQGALRSITSHQSSVPGHFRSTTHSTVNSQSAGCPASSVAVSVTTHAMHPVSRCFRCFPTVLSARSFATPHEY